MWMKNLVDILHEELNIGYNDEINLGEESSKEMSESESETSVLACCWVGRCDNG
jgi:hypothetical protein